MLSAPVPVLQLYMTYIYYFQTSSPKSFSQSKAKRGEPPWQEGTKVCINDQGHMTKMAATPI